MNVGILKKIYSSSHDINAFYFVQLLKLLKLKAFQSQYPERSYKIYSIIQLSKYHTSASDKDTQIFLKHIFLPHCNIYFPQKALQGLSFC